METALFLPDTVYYEVEETARRLGISPGALYLNALEEYLQRNSQERITQTLNTVYTDDYDKEFEPIAHAGLASIRELTKDDAW